MSTLQVAPAEASRNATALHVTENCASCNPLLTPRDEWIAHQMNPSSWPQACERCGAILHSFYYRHDARCGGCGKCLQKRGPDGKWLGYRADRFYCANACRQRAYRKRAAGQVPA